MVVKNQRITGGVTIAIEVLRPSQVLFTLLADVPTNGIALPEVVLTYTGSTQLKEHNGKNMLYYATVSDIAGPQVFDLIACVATLKLP